MGQQSIKEKCDGFNSVFSILPNDLLKPIISYANNKGLDLKNYRNQIFVCKRWRDIAMNGITHIDITALTQTSIHRKCTLLANIIMDDTLLQFSNLNSLKIDFANIDNFELYQKIKYEGKRNFDNNKSYFSDDKKLDRLHFSKSSNVAKDIKSAGTGNLMSLMWTVYQYNNIIGMSQEEQSHKKKEVDDHLNDIITAKLSNFQMLETLKIHTSVALNLGFIHKIRTLKYLYVYSSSYNVKCTFNDIFPHDIESFVSNSQTNIGDPQKWNINFPHLKELSINLGIRFQRRDLIIAELTEIVDNLPNLESLFVSGNNENRPFQILSKLTKLKKLDLSKCVLSEHDLIDIAEIITLKELILWSQGARHYFFNSDDLLLFRVKRPDVKINIVDY
jgi:hypothetical protein